MQLHFEEMLLIMDNEQTRCVVFEVTTDVIIKMLDQWTVKQSLEQGMQKTFNQTRVDVQSVQAYFCDLDDINRQGFSHAKKRDLLQPLQFELDFEMSLKLGPVFQVCKMVEMSVPWVALKLSIPELYVFQSIVLSHIEHVLTLTELWVKYSDHSDQVKLQFESEL